MRWLSSEVFPQHQYRCQSDIHLYNDIASDPRTLWYRISQPNVRCFNALLPGNLRYGIA